MPTTKPKGSLSSEFVLPMHPALSIGIFLTFLTLVVAVWVRDPFARLAHACLDDHPTVFANILKFPERFNQDIISEYGVTFAKATFLHRIPFWMENHLHIPSLAISQLLVWWQTVGIGIAFLFLYYSLGVSVSPLTFGLTFGLIAAEPWAWNIAWYPSFIHSPYAGQFVLSFLTAALASIVGKREGLAFCFLLLAAIFHPSLTVGCCGILGFYSLFTLKSDRRQAMLQLVAIALLLLICAIPGIYLAPKGVDLLPQSTVMAGLLRNGHITPWKEAGVLDGCLPMLLTAIVGAGYFLYSLPFSDQAKKLYWASLSYFGLAIVLQVSAGTLEILPLTQLIPMRVSELVGIYCSAIFFYGLSRELFTGDTPAKISAIFLLYATALLKIAALPFLLVSLLLPRQRFTKLREAWVLIFTVGSFFAVWGFRGFGWEILKPLVHTRVLFLTAAPGITASILLGLMLFSWFLLKIPPRKLPILLCLTLGGILFHTAYKEGNQVYQADFRDRYDLQKWAKFHSPKESLFITPFPSWRGVSERAAIATYNLGFEPFVYTRRKSTKEYFDRLAEFKSSRGLTSLNEAKDQDIIEFVKQFGGDYLIRSKQHSPLNLPLIYENPSYAIYSTKVPTSF